MKPPKPKNTHGGHRKGAGRKPSGKAGVNLTVRLPVETKARIQGLAKDAGVSAGEIVRRRFENDHQHPREDEA